MKRGGREEGNEEEKDDAANCLIVNPCWKEAPLPFWGRVSGGFLISILIRVFR